MKKLIIIFLIIISGCISHNITINNNELYSVVNSYIARNKKFKFNNPVKLNKYSYHYNWSKYLDYPAIISLNIGNKERNEISKLYEDVLEDDNYNRKIFDSIERGYRKKFMIKNDSLDKIYKQKFHANSNSFLTSEDYEYMKKQTESNSHKKLKWDKGRLNNVIFDKKGQAFSIPVFSKNGKYAILYSYTNGGATLLYFEKTDNGWLYIGDSLAWIK